ncbi:hypothetical protein FRC09_003958 [Ceratobasidium sp. 395]|nr:hypothetical protein FRC09_003958 [Ceratobasidium sp. 395]
MKPPQTHPVNSATNVLPRHGACLVCRKRKLKCDATKPECNECLATGRTCQYEDETYRSRTQQLQDRIKELEAKIKEAEEKGSQFSSKPQSSNASTGNSTRVNNSPEVSGTSHYPSSSTSGSASVSPLGNLLSIPVNSSSSPGSFSPGRSPSELSTGSNRPSTPYEPTSEQTKKLLEVFILRQAQCGFELHMDRVIRNLSLGAAEPVIPALLNTMLLLGCHFTEDSSLKHLESILLERAKKDIEDNLDRALRGNKGHKNHYSPVHHLQAMCMLGLYYYIKGRLLEGHFHCTGAVRFAVAMGFHQITSRIFKPNSPTQKLKRIFTSEHGHWRPRDPIELGEAINVWWICCSLDYGGSTMNGLPLSVSQSDIKTVWPRGLSDFETGRLSDDNYSTAALVDPLLTYDVADASRDNAKSLLSKASVLMAFAGQLDTERVTDPSVSEEWWTRFENCDRAIVRFMETLPPVRIASNVEELAYLVLIHTATYCANVQLHGALAEYEIAIGARGDLRGIQPDGSLGGLSYARCMEACRATTLAATLVADIDLTYMHMFIGLAWVCVAEVLTRDVPRLRQSGHTQSAREKEEQLNVMERSMERLVATYPVLGEWFMGSSSDKIL